MGWFIEPKSQLNASKQYDILADTAADVSSLPTTEEDIAVGSSCLVIGTGDVYILNSQRQWVAIGG